jgi:hypothetical protein
MNPPSRPLRAIILVVGVWSCGRLYVMWPNSSATVSLAHQLAVEPGNVHRNNPHQAANHIPDIDHVSRLIPAVSSHPSISASKFETNISALVIPVPVERLDFAGPTYGSQEVQVMREEGVQTAALSRQAIAPVQISFSSWALVRNEGNGVQLADNGTLGGSQAGFRVRFSPWQEGPLSRLTLTGRVSSPLAQQRGKEAALGLVWHPAHLPLEIFAERRIAIDRGGRNAWSLFAVGSVYDHPLPLHLRFDGYVQAGVVGAHRRNGFIDGQLSIQRPLATSDHGGVSVGIGLWGAAQPRLTRLDVGPQLVMRTPALGGHWRMSLEWRHRIAGNAKPASGPSISIGNDF